ncbi:hypothetical protein DEU56DRAFT_139530 [Suillus clintonianus]|uniref:uncharacterized protein n=1 Tax=Suillus clintonianus TaxID=1904413 RepID=UPI001B87793E|nr:uncharacterized protein DEU56DRAFT_139530 [Suillus clintonianus]KAG2118468.1 hypothetical protein DEU56DRAFT_139530 [Suillus clintonianus]
MTVQNSGHQRSTDRTAFHSFPENPILHSETADDTTVYYPQDSWYPPPVDNNLAQAYVWSQVPWYGPGELSSPSLQVMTSQPPVEPLPVATPPQAQSALSPCEWIEDGVRCGQPISGDMRKLGTHLGDAHNIHGHERKPIVCFWPGCGRKMQRGGIRRHIASCHLFIKSSCTRCSKEYSRRDAMRKHAKQCRA